jgi:hypothetical protein
LVFTSFSICGNAGEGGDFDLEEKVMKYLRQ